MPEFTGDSQIIVFDMLTILVMIEQCVPELSVVTWYEGTPLQPYDVAPPKTPWRVQSSPWNPPRKYTACMECLLRSVAHRAAEDGRAQLIQSVRSGAIHVVAIGPRSDTWKCPRCQAMIIL